MSKTKVLQFSIGNMRGGVTQYALNNWKFIDKNKFQFDFVTFGGKLDFEEELTSQGCKVHYISCYAEEQPEQFVKEINQMLQENYDVLHLHTEYWRGFLVEELAMQYGVPKIIIHSHNGGVGEDSAILAAEKTLQLRKVHQMMRNEISPLLATDFWGCSKLAAEWLFGEQVPKEQIKIMNNAIDIDEFSYDAKKRAAYRKELRLEHCFVMGNVGRFAHQKNHDLLLEIFRKVSCSIPNARLMLIGVGGLENKIREKVHAYNLQDQVLFMGKRSDVNGLMQAMDVFLLPSLFEGLPIVLVEAQTSGLKCLTSSFVTQEIGITENIEFLPLDAETWVQRICALAGGYQRKKMDDIVANAGYDIRNQIKILEQLYVTHSIHKQLF